MGVSALQLVGDGGGHRVEVELAPLFGYPRQEHHLEQQIAELVPHRDTIGAGDGVSEFMRLLERVRDDRLHRLRAVPLASALGIAQTPHHLEQASDGRHGCAHAASSSPRSSR